MRPLFNRLARYFVEGLLIIMPFGLTVFLIAYGFVKLQQLVHFIIGHVPLLSRTVHVPGLSLLISCAAVCFLGYLASNFIVRTVLSLLEWIVLRIPIANILYAYIKDSASAFVDKFNRPVLITINKSLALQKLGFITQQELPYLQEKEKVAVYVPHCYGFSGELNIVPTAHVKPLNLSSAEVLRFILSGGLSEIKQPLTVTKQPVQQG